MYINMKQNQDQGQQKELQPFDLNNGIKEISDDVFDPDIGETINRTVQYGSDSGIRRTLMIDNDQLSRRFSSNHKQKVLL